jgi:two-component system, NarL family, response regulator
MIRLLCVEDEPMVLEYLVARLKREPDVEVVGAVADAGSAFALLREHPVDVLLLDYRLQGADGLHLVRVLSIWHSENRPHAFPAVLFCTGWMDPTFEAEALRAGVAGVLPKTRAAEDLVVAIRTVAAGGRWFDPASAPEQPAVLAPEVSRC